MPMPMPMPDASPFWAGPVVSIRAGPNIPHGFPLHIHLIPVLNMYPYRIRPFSGVLFGKQIISMSKHNYYYLIYVGYWDTPAVTQHDNNISTGPIESISKYNYVTTCLLDMSGSGISLQ